MSIAAYSIAIGASFGLTTGRDATAATEAPFMRSHSDIAHSRARTNRLRAREPRCGEGAGKAGTSASHDLGLAVPFPDEAQALQRQVRIDLRDRPRVRRDQVGEPTRGDHGRV